MNYEETVENLIGESFTEDEIPAYPARIFWYDGKFLTGFPRCPIRVAEVRFREAYQTEDGDFTIYEARRIDTSNPEDSHGEWKSEDL